MSDVDDAFGGAPSSRRRDQVILLAGLLFIASLFACLVWRRSLQARLSGREADLLEPQDVAALDASMQSDREALLELSLRDSDIGELSRETLLAQRPSLTAEELEPAFDLYVVGGEAARVKVLIELAEESPAVTELLLAKACRVSTAAELRELALLAFIERADPARAVEGLRSFLAEEPEAWLRGPAIAELAKREGWEAVDLSGVASLDVEARGLLLSRVWERLPRDEPTPAPYVALCREHLKDLQEADDSLLSSQSSWPMAAALGVLSGEDPSGTAEEVCARVKPERVASLLMSSFQAEASELMSSFQAEASDGAVVRPVDRRAFFDAVRERLREASMTARFELARARLVLEVGDNADWETICAGIRDPELTWSDLSEAVERLSRCEDAPRSRLAEALRASLDDPASASRRGDREAADSLTLELEDGESER